MPFTLVQKDLREKKMEPESGSLTQFGELSCWQDTSRCVEYLYNRHIEKEEHTNVSVIDLMCRFITLCVADPIWGVCCDSYTLSMSPTHCQPIVLTQNESTWYGNSFSTLITYSASVFCKEITRWRGLILKDNSF